jgi:hypothetical protein
VSSWSGPPRRYYWMEQTPGSIQVRASKYNPLVPRPSMPGDGEGGGTRGQITGFSADSRERLLRRAVSLSWEEAVGAGGIGMVTFTYPDVFPTDGRVAKAQLKCMYERWRTRYSKPKGMWKMEFQRRGAPHFHCFVGLPRPEDELGGWLLRQWYEVVGSGDEHHLFHGVDISRWRWGSLGESRARVGEYFARHGAKGWQSYQNRVPDGYVSPGQFWGVWGLKPVIIRIPLQRDEYWHQRRVATPPAGPGTQSRRGVVFGRPAGSRRRREADGVRHLRAVSASGWGQSGTGVNRTGLAPRRGSGTWGMSDGACEWADLPRSSRRGYDWSSGWGVWG